MLNGFKIVDTEIKSINGYKTAKIISNFSRPGIKLKQAIYSIKKNNKIWVITYSTGVDEFEKRLPVFEESINTFQIKS